MDIAIVVLGILDSAFRILAIPPGTTTFLLKTKKAVLCYWLLAIIAGFYRLLLLIRHPED